MILKMPGRWGWGESMRRWHWIMKKVSLLGENDQRYEGSSNWNTTRGIACAHILTTSITTTSHYLVRVLMHLFHDFPDLLSFCTRCVCHHYFCGYLRIATYVQPFKFEPYYMCLSRGQSPLFILSVCMRGTPHLGEQSTKVLKRKSPLLATV